VGINSVRKRSKYKPKPVRTDTMAYVVSGMKKFDEISVAVDLRIRNHSAIEALRLGRATRADMDTIIHAFNMTEGLMRQREDLGQDWRAEIGAGQDALLAVAKRGLERGSFICRPEEWTALTLAMQIHDAQLDQATVKDLELAMDAIKADIRNKKAREIA